MHPSFGIPRWSIAAAPWATARSSCWSAPVTFCCACRCQMPRIGAWGFPAPWLDGFMESANAANQWMRTGARAYLVGRWNINFIFPYIGLLIIPIDFHIFQRGGPGPPTRDVSISDPQWPRWSSQPPGCAELRRAPRFCIDATVAAVASEVVSGPLAACGDTGMVDGQGCAD